MSEETFQLILLIVLTLLGGGVGGGALYARGKGVGRQELGEQWEKKYNETNTKLVIQMERNDKLEKDLHEQFKLITETNHRVQFLTEALANERKHNDENVRQYGGLEVRFETMQNDVKKLQDDLKQLRDTNRQLEADKLYLEEKNVALEGAKKNCERLTKENEQLRRELERTEKRVKQLEDLVAKLRENTPPTPPGASQPEPEAQPGANADSQHVDNVVNMPGQQSKDTAA